MGSFSPYSSHPACAPYPAYNSDSLTMPCHNCANPTSISRKDNRGFLVPVPVSIRHFHLRFLSFGSSPCTARWGTQECRRARRLSRGADWKNEDVCWTGSYLNRNLSQEIHPSIRPDLGRFRLCIKRTWPLFSFRLSWVSCCFTHVHTFFCCPPSCTHLFGGGL